MAEPAPDGVFPLFIRGVTAEKYGFKNGENVMDLVDHLYISKEVLEKEIQVLGVMSDFEPANKYIKQVPGEEVLFVVDKLSKYGEMFLLCYTESSIEIFVKSISEAADALAEQKRAEEKAEEDRKAAEYARLNVVYEDKPIEARPWVTESQDDTESEINILQPQYLRENIKIEVTRPKKNTKLNYRLSDRNANQSGNIEFKSYKDPNFRGVRENEIGIQSAPQSGDSTAQTTWYRSVNKAIQYEPNSSSMEDHLTGDSKNNLLDFLERVTVKVENALQQNESVDIFHEAFRLAGDDDTNESDQAENELREIKNFADPTYSKFKALIAIDAVPKSNGLVAVSAVRNISFDQRVTLSGQTSSSYILLWDFRQLVKPAALLQSQNEMFCFRFNKSLPSIVAGGSITGQVVLWDLSEALSAASRKNNRNANNVDEEEKELFAAVTPKYVSHLDYSHKKSVADLFWLPTNTQINYRGQLVADEHLEDKSYQFVTCSGDGVIMVWDTRFEKISNDEVKHVGRAKHVPVEKISGKEGFKLLWVPIYRAPLKRLEGVGELSINKITCSGNLKKSIASKSSLAGDYRSHMMVTTEEGDVLFADICATKAESKSNNDDDDHEEDLGRDYVKWCMHDHPRPAVALQQSPFFPDILLSVGDWGFHIWKVGLDRPLFTSPQSHNYLTSGAWSPTRPAVLLLSCIDGQVLAWDFTDSSFRPSIELKATHVRISSMEYLAGPANSRQQLLAVGDETGVLHIFEMPRNLMRPVHKEEIIMSMFLDREKLRLDYLSTISRENNDTNQGNFGEVVHEAHEGLDAVNQEEAAKAAFEALKKEEDDFLKLELAFIQELNLNGTSN